MKNKNKSGGKPKEAALELEGVVLQAVKDGFKVQVDTHVISCKLAGALRKNFIRVVPGDRVKIEVSPYDLNSGRIVFRLK